VVAWPGLPYLSVGLVLMHVDHLCVQGVFMSWSIVLPFACILYSRGNVVVSFHY